MSKALDRVGHTFGKLSVVSFSHRDRKTSYWLCKCQCGNEKIIAAKHFSSTTTCGCYEYKRTVSTSRGVDISGMKVGMLTVIEKSHKRSSGDWVWVCKCGCGNGYSTTATKLIRGKVDSCGCLKKKRLSESVEAIKKPIQRKLHGLSVAS